MKVTKQKEKKGDIDMTYDDVLNTINEHFEGITQQLNILVNAEKQHSKRIKDLETAYNQEKKDNETLETQKKLANEQAAMYQQTLTSERVDHEKKVKDLTTDYEKQVQDLTTTINEQQAEIAKLRVELERLDKVKVNKINTQNSAENRKKGLEVRRGKAEDRNTQIGRQMNKWMTEKGTTEQTRTITFDAIMFKSKAEYQGFCAWLEQVYDRNPYEVLPGSEHLCSWYRWHKANKKDKFKNVKNLK